MLAPEDLDRWLARGWFRSGSALFTTSFLASRESLTSALWTRLPLTDHRSTKSHRRALNRVERRFRVESGPLHLTPAHQQLYERYLTHVGGARVRSLQRFLFDDTEPPSAPFHTNEIRIFDGDELVAFSLFDVGQRSVQSLMGVYDPAHAAFGLGFATMLLEIRWAVDRDLEFHYSGYILPEDSSMDYKRRVGPLEVLDPIHHDWIPLESLPSTSWPGNRLRTELQEARSTLAYHGVDTHLDHYRMFEAPAWQPDLKNCLGHPLVLVREPALADGSRHLVAYDLDSDTWSLARGVMVPGEIRRTDDSSVPPDPVSFWVLLAQLKNGVSPEDLLPDLLRARLSE